MHPAARTPFSIVTRGPPRAALAVAIAMLVGRAPCASAATVVAPAVAPTKVSPQPAAAIPSQAPSTVPSVGAVLSVNTVPSVGAVGAPVQLSTPPIQLNLVPASPASMAPPTRTLLRDAVLLTGRRYVRTLVIPTSGTIQVLVELRGVCDATLSLEPASMTGGDRLSADLRSPAANRRHGATLVGQRVLREYQVTPRQVANGGSFLVSVTPVVATLSTTASELSFEINLK